MRDDDWFRPHHDRPAALPRQPKPGEEVWRLRDRDTGRVQTCVELAQSMVGELITPVAGTGAWRAWKPNRRPRH